MPWPKGRPQSLETRAKMTGRKMTAEACAKMSAASRGRPKSPEHCARISVALRSRSPEIRAAAADKIRGELNPAWKGSTVGYAGIHARIRHILRGKICSFCGSSEQIEVALDPDTPMENQEMEGNLRYSIRVEDYIPLCVTCHRRLDLGENS